MDKYQEYSWVGCNIDVFDQNGVWGERKMPEFPIEQDYLRFSPYAHPTVMYRASIFDTNEGYVASKETLRCEDYEIFMRLRRAGLKGANIQDKLLAYRENKDSYKSVVFAIDGMRQNADIVILKPWVFYSQRDGYMFYYQLQHARFHIGYWHGINVKNHQYSKIDIGMEKKIMKKRAVMALIALSLAIQLTACKADTEKVVSTEYEQMINLNNDGEMTIFETEAEQEIVTTEEQEADGNEEIETRELAANADVYSKPDTEATVVGNLKKEKYKCNCII